MKNEAMEETASRRFIRQPSAELDAIGVPAAPARPELDSARYWAREMALAARAADLARREECREKMMLSLRALDDSRPQARRAQ